MVLLWTKQCLFYQRSEDTRRKHKTIFLNLFSEMTMLDKMRQWTPPDHWRTVTTIDAHTGGEPFRIITGGLPEVKGDTILQRRRYAT